MILFISEAPAKALMVAVLIVLAFALLAFERLRKN